MKKTFAAMLSLAMALALGLAACGDASSSQPSSESTPPSQSADSSSLADSSTIPVGYAPVTLTDQGGFEVTIENEPARVAIAGLPPFASFFIQFTGNTNLLVAMPAGSLTQPVWVDRVFPGFADIPTVGFGPNFEVEEILALEPDLIICSTGFEEKYQALRESDVPTIGLSSVADGTDTIATASSWYTILGQVFHQEDKAAALVQHADELKTLVADHTALITEPLSGLMLPDYSETIIEASNDEYYGGYWLANAGLANAASGLAGWEAGMEDVLSWNPDVIYLSAFSAYQPSQMMADAAVEGHSWSSTTAGANGQIHKFPVGLFNWYALSPDAPLSQLWIAMSAYPDVYADVDLTAEVKAHYALFGIELTDAEVADMLAQG